MRIAITFCLVLMGSWLYAQVQSAQTTQTSAQSSTGTVSVPPAITNQNTVIEKDGDLYVQTTTVSQVKASSDLVLQKIEKLEEQKVKIMEEQIKQIDKSIAELKSLHFELLKREKKQKNKDDKSRQ